MLSVSARTMPSIANCTAGHQKPWPMKFVSMALPSLYWPIWKSGGPIDTTSGSGGSRSAKGGISPAAAARASTGAS